MIANIKGYWPIVLLYVVSAVGAYESAIYSGMVDSMTFMMYFMAWMYILFALPKILSLTTFAQRFRAYDMLAVRSRLYGYLYPFIELGLGISYFTGKYVPLAIVITVLTSGLGVLSVWRVLHSSEQNTHVCACLGSLFDAPVSYVTLVEKGIMLAMGVSMLPMLT
jgi:hypothetical protein